MGSGGVARAVERPRRQSSGRFYAVFGIGIQTKSMLRLEKCWHSGRKLVAQRSQNSSVAGT